MNKNCQVQDALHSSDGVLRTICLGLDESSKIVALPWEPRPMLCDSKQSRNDWKCWGNHVNVRCGDVEEFRWMHFKSREASFRSSLSRSVSISWRN